MSNVSSINAAPKATTAAAQIVEHFVIREAQLGRVRDSFRSPLSGKVETNALSVPVPLLRALVAEHHATARTGRAVLRSEVVVWTPVEDGLPDADLTVNIMLTAESDEPIWLGYYDGEMWRDIEGMPVDVVAWSPMLKGMA
ncbi:hypothetical protein [Variovorax sp. E3]|uniref:hypothetical protein n=1 Tax=Variovorax sp. E3 TaxID=1914993 RepID=UPI0018DBB017|nr:hypothetical protein [Variovorax sp. E3]